MIEVWSLCFEKENIDKIRDLLDGISEDERRKTLDATWRVSESCQAM